MRKLILILLASFLILPAAALAWMDSPGDGSLVVSSGDGKLALQGRGVIFGHFDRGKLTVVGDYKPDDNTALSSVSGAKMTVVGRNVVYSGTDVRFFFPGGQYNLIVDGTNIDISAVGSGKFSEVGAGTGDDGTYTADGGRPQLVGLIGSVSYGSKGAANPNISSSSSSSRVHS